MNQQELYFAFTMLLTFHFVNGPISSKTEQLIASPYLTSHLDTSLNTYFSFSVL